MVRRPRPFALSVAALAAKSKSTRSARPGAFDFAALRSGQTEPASTASEEVYESHVVRFSISYPEDMLRPAQHERRRTINGFNIATVRPEPCDFAHAKSVEG